MYIIVVILLIITLVIGILMWLQHEILFMPTDDFCWHPSGHENLAIPVKSDREICEETIILKCGDKIPKDHINAWYFEMYPGNKVILFNHGNAGNISHREYLVKLAREFKLNVFMYDYRGFGKSPGAPCASSILEDGVTAYKYLRTRVDPSKIIVWGESLGGAVSVKICSSYPCSHLLLMCTFSSLSDAVEHGDLSKWSKKAMSFLVESVLDRLNSKMLIRKVKCPIAIIHSEEDDLIPYECGRILYRNIRHNNRLMITIKGTHSGPKIKPRQLKKLFQFCNSTGNGEDPIHCPDHSRLKEMTRMIETVAENHIANMAKK